MGNLSKFGVPLDGNKLGMLQPKLAYRFRVIFEGFGTNNNLRELTANVLSVTRPAITYTDIPVHSYNSIAYAMGKHEWQPVDLIIRDDITGAVASAIGAQVQRQLNHYWQLDGCFLTNVQNNEYNYESGGEYMRINMTVRYDNASLLSGPNDNEGTTVGGDPFPNLEDGFTGGTTVG